MVFFSCLNERKSESQKIDNLPVLLTCWSGTLVILSSKVNGPVAHGRPLTNLTETFQVCHLCTFNVAAISWWCRACLHLSSGFVGEGRASLLSFPSLAVPFNRLLSKSLDGNKTEFIHTSV